MGALEEEEEGTPVEPRKAIMPRLAPPTTPPEERRSDPDNIVKLLAALGAPSDATNTSPVLRLIWTRALCEIAQAIPCKCVNEFTIHEFRGPKCG